MLDVACILVSSDGGEGKQRGNVAREGKKQWQRSSVTRGLKTGAGEVAALCSKLTTMNVSDLFYDLLLILIVFAAMDLL